MPDLRTRLESSLGASYTIERELGGGGMARVFVATERALDRRVVIKVLSPELAAEVSAKRFAREIRLAASLQQANIVPVLSAGETDGIPHYTMPFVEGMSLRDRLDRDKVVPLQEVGSILRDIARALLYAHEHGVVHRDIKPENVLLSGDAAVVTDFGIAKAISSSRNAESREPRAEGTVTQIGTSVGTPAYMAPEQISADPAIDHRADIYSFGCLAYELVSGKPPFGAASVHTLFAAHLSERPVSLLERNPDTAPALATIIQQCLEKDPARRPQTAREILRVLEGPTTEAGAASRFVRRMPRSQRRVALALAAILSVVALWRAAAALGTLRPVPSVAVIPFFNVSRDSTDDYLADGMADGLATALGKVDGIKVASRSLGYQYRGRRDLDAHAVGAALGVSHVLHGSLRRVGDRLRVSAQLTRASDNNEVWSDEYDRRAMDAFAVQDEITRLVASALPRSFRAGASPELPVSASSGTSNPEAYDLYLRGRFLLQRRGPGVRQSVEKFRQAIAKDSNFARGYAGLALALELLPYFEPVNANGQSAYAIPAARHALALDSTLAEAHTALALAHHHAYQWRDAEAELVRAIALEPNEVDAHIQYGRFLFCTGRFREAQREFMKAREVDPTSAVASGWVAHLLDLAGDNAGALVEVRRAMELDSTSPPALFMAVQVHRNAGLHRQAKQLVDRLYRRVPTWRQAAASLYVTLGDSSFARQVVREADAAGDTSAMQVFATMARLVLGDTARALDGLERGTEARHNWPMTWSMSEREFDKVRPSKRFAAVVRRVGLDERIFTSPTGGRPR